MHFSISIAPAIFQRYINRLLETISMVAAYLDDTIKSQYFQNQIEFRGHTIFKDYIVPSPSKIQAIQEMRVSLDKHQLRSFLGSVNFCNRSIPNLQSTCGPLYRLTCSFETVKHSMLARRVLRIYGIDKEMYLACDAIDRGLGLVLFQKQKNNKYAPIAYASRNLKTSKKKLFSNRERIVGSTLWNNDIPPIPGRAKVCALE
ncbi:hypothetical protein GJ496_000038 [Pomphorhynchus laevis]|nr:hypothetical protein GJ496_000038 [Pomphorhynchus laevis]